jgi:hypothetical protein
MLPEENELRSPNSGTRGSLLERVERLEAQLKAAL